MNISIKKFVLILVTSMMVTACASSSKKQDSFELINKADAAYIESRWMEASQYYHQVTVQVPEDSYAWFRLGNVQMRQARIDSAIYSYTQALARDPNHAKANYNLAMAYLFKSLYAMEAARGDIRETDGGRRVIEQKLKQLRDIVDQPLETTLSKPADRMDHYESVH